MRLSIVVPCYNESAVLADSTRRLRLVLEELRQKGKIAAASNLWLIDDGSTDDTWPLIRQLAAAHADVVGVKLSHNCGHQNALLAGIEQADGEAVVTLDADLQDDITAIEAMVDAHAAGSEVVFGVRRDRGQDSPFKRGTARAYYRLLRVLGVEVVPDHADFRLLGRAARGALLAHPEGNLFLRGLVPRLGFRSTRVLYERQPRAQGRSKYSLARMLGLGIDGITSFSAVPLRMIAAVGACLFVIAMAVSLWVLGVRLFTARAIPGWASTTLPIYALGGVQLLSLGLVGEYVAKIYMEVKRRPRYLVEQVTRDQQSYLQQQVVADSSSDMTESGRNCRTVK
ncbi:MAG TPA: glycosyltransferase family 2 protein [Steroidobacteraceae bacterium]|nr:glycosyltransferase family 2 protein [Steroidobacteraceae bacterium]